MSSDKKSVDAADKEPSQRSAAAEEGPTTTPEAPEAPETREVTEATPVDNFLLICENLPSDTEEGIKMKQAFRAAGMSLSRKDPTTFQLVFSSNQQEMLRGLQTLKEKHNELAKDFPGMDLYQF